MTNQSNEAIASPATDYVLPMPVRAAGEVVVLTPQRDGAGALRRGGEVARAIGERMLAFAENQQLLTTELRDRLQALDVEIADASRAQLRGAVHDVIAVLDWCDAAQTEMVRESRLAASGRELIDLPDLCECIAEEVRAQGLQVSVTGRSGRALWGEALALVELIRQAVAIVAERAAGAAIAIAVGCVDAGIEVSVGSAGEPGDGVEPATVRRFRAAVEGVGATVLPGALGPGGASLRLVLPTP